MMCSKDFGVKLMVIIDRSSKIEQYSDIPVLKKFPKSVNFDAIVVTDLGNPKQEYDKLVSLMEPERVFAPEILNVSPTLCATNTVKKK